MRPAQIIAQSKKKLLEDIDLDYLCKNFRLQNGNKNTHLSLNGYYPDLFSKLGNPDIQPLVFEMKSRHFPREQQGKRKRPISDFAWWDLVPKQIERYETTWLSQGYELFWIFLLGQIPKKASQISSITEEHILVRDIFITSWDAYNRVNPSKSNIRYMGLARLKRNYEFKEHSVKKGRLFIPGSIEKKVGKYFLE